MNLHWNQWWQIFTAKFSSRRGFTWSGKHWSWKDGYWRTRGWGNQGAATVASWLLSACVWCPLSGLHSFPGQLLLILQVSCHMLPPPEANPDFPTDIAPVWLSSPFSLLPQPPTSPLHGSYQQQCSCSLSCVSCQTETVSSSWSSWRCNVDWEGRELLRNGSGNGWDYL